MSAMQTLWKKLKSKQGISVHVMSDLHLEVGKQYETFDIPARAPYLVLVGDTGRLKDYDSYLGFLAKLTGRFMRVFLVLGNHEFDGISRQDGLKLAKSLEEEPCLFGRLTALNHTLVEVIPGFVILGCTLHSHILARAMSLFE
jgi:predicted MPP superfamily phosphohydrolase